MSQDDLKGLTLLGRGMTRLPKGPDDAKLESFPNRFPHRDYTIQFNCPEFTSVCPVTGQPDFAKIIITYIPHLRCLESKSLKFYLGSFRNVGMFHEEITNRILDDLIAACDPRWARVRGIMNPRGGISIDVTAEYCMPDYKPPGRSGHPQSDDRRR
ncbi:MAG: NADPH-dependent 7-cyano-7-deazaguanine reductase QueF [Deltaproteobacteria bacterium]|nr:NADPH-dependent 7-cyano-7-deazaguanine reductase QueF [Deltaproteobacteria bacterium]